MLTTTPMPSRVYVVVHSDRHCDDHITCFIEKDKAVAFAIEIGHEYNCCDREDRYFCPEECVYHEYLSGEGDFVKVLDVELR